MFCYYSVRVANRITSSAMRRAESGWARVRICALSALRRAGSCRSARAVGMSCCCASASLTSTAASFLTNAMALCVWWSSATLGEGTRMAGLPSRHNSLMLLAPAREMTKSANAYRSGMLLRKGVTTIGQFDN